MQEKINYSLSSLLPTCPVNPTTIHFNILSDLGHSVLASNYSRYSLITHRLLLTIYQAGCMRTFSSFSVTPESIPQSHSHCKSAPAAAFLSPCLYLLWIHSASPFNLFQTQSFFVALNPSKHLMQILRKSFQGNTQAESRHTSFFLLLRSITPTLVQSSVARSMHQAPFSFFP